MPPKKSKKSTRTSAVSDSLGKESIKTNFEDLIKDDPQFYRGNSSFKFPNGDEYDGDFCAHSSGIVWRQGTGTYTTNDGQMYIGDWEDDRLDETKEIVIVYPDGTKYVGSLLKNKYSGTGIFQFDENVSLMTNFVENKPTGEIILIDPNENAWHGFAEKDDSLLIPEHVFYRCIGKDLGKGRPRARPRAKSLNPSEPDGTERKYSQQRSDASLPKEPKYSDIRDIEKQIFAKTKKTPSDLDFHNSEWYKEYETYKNTYGDIVCKAKNHGEMSLTASEYDWYIRYKEFERRYIASLNNFKNKTKKGMPSEKLFEMIHSDEYRHRNKPVPVFYPTEETDDDCDSSCECGDH